MCRRLAAWTICMQYVQRFGAGGSGTKHQGPFRSQDKFDVLCGMPVRSRDVGGWRQLSGALAGRLGAYRAALWRRLHRMACDG